MTSKKNDLAGESEFPVLDSSAASASTPLIARLAHEIPKPNDWQAFQRACVLLFRAELNDPNTQEYGRGGQNQCGIDLLGRRNADPDNYVGVQCRLIVKPLKEKKILSDCRAALELKAGLKEIIFATTAPDDNGATDAAIAVERTLRAEGYNIIVAVYGWRALQTLIATHEIAYHAFFPSAVATFAPQPASVPQAYLSELSTHIAAQVGEQLRELISSPREVDESGWAHEDPALHARIDTFRDLFKDQRQPLLAERGFLELLASESLDHKPWARFRIETNLGSIAIHLGREADGATRYEAAYAAQPDNPNAIANLALARTIQCRFAEAMDLARRALDAHPRADHAVGCLLQSAARSNWEGEPESLIPPDLDGSAYADLGLAEFLRFRKTPGWAERNLELARKHPDVPEFKGVGATAALSLALESGAIVPGGRGPISVEDLNSAADDMKALAEQCLDINFADHHDMVAYLNNAAVLLRLVGRQAECEALLRRGMEKVPDEPLIRRVLALAQAAQGHPAEALATLQCDEDVENRLLAAELTAIENPGEALDKVLAIEPEAVSPNLIPLRWRLIGELALKTGNELRLTEAITGLRVFDPEDVSPDLLQLHWDQKSGMAKEAVLDRLRGMAKALRADADMVTRYFLAEELRNQDLSEEAWLLLEGHVDLTRPSPVCTLYLQSLAAARRDDAFRKAVISSGPAVQGGPEILWTIATHAWNVGDLSAALDAAEKLLASDLENAQARLLKIEVLVRQNRSFELFAELDKHVENLTFKRLKDRFRIASLLGSFGYTERAAALAYRLFLENRDRSQAWMTLSVLVLEEGRGEETRKAWDTPTVAPDVAVDLRFDNGEELFFVIEPNPDLRRLDNESWEPDHPFVRKLTGLAKGERFVDPNGREGTVVELRHKYVARLHYVLQHYETRFPGVQGFRSVPFDAERPGGLDKFIAELKARHDWFEEEQESYKNGPWPLGVLAHRLGLDTIDVAAGLVSQGGVLKVAFGNEPEREAVAKSVRENGRKGCILDLLAFWTAWRLNALDSISATCGTIQLTQSVMDRLRFRREHLQFSIKDGLRSVRYEGGKVALTETAPEMISGWLDDLDRAITWVEGNAAVSPLVVGDDLPAILREHLRAIRSDVFDSLILAMQKKALLITDDLPTREFGRLFSFGNSAWLHQVFGVALDQRRIDLDTYTRWSANLVDAGHSYIGVSGQVLAQSVRIDAQQGEAPGYLFRTLSKVIGGRSAEPQSHIAAVLGCLRELWSDSSTRTFRQPTTGLLLRQLIRERRDDYAVMLRTLLHFCSDMPELVRYVHAWRRGHFLPAATLGS